MNMHNHHISSNTPFSIQPHNNKKTNKTVVEQQPKQKRNKRCQATHQNTQQRRLLPPPPQQNPSHPLHGTRGSALQSTVSRTRTPTTSSTTRSAAWAAY
jgi:hypothetical protein